MYEEETTVHDSELDEMLDMSDDDMEDADVEEEDEDDDM